MGLCGCWRQSKCAHLLAQATWILDAPADVQMNLPFFVPKSKVETLKTWPLKFKVERYFSLAELLYIYECFIWYMPIYIYIYHWLQVLDDFMQMTKSVGPFGPELVAIPTPGVGLVHSLSTKLCDGRSGRRRWGSRWQGWRFLEDFLIVLSTRIHSFLSFQKPTIVSRFDSFFAFFSKESLMWLIPHWMILGCGNPEIEIAIACV